MPTEPNPNLAECLQWCRAMLHVHGVLPEGESNRVLRRLVRKGMTLELAQTAETYGTRRVNPDAD